jgi:hypothetical protein
MTRPLPESKAFLEEATGQPPDLTAPNAVKIATTPRQISQPIPLSQMTRSQRMRVKRHRLHRPLVQNMSPRKKLVLSVLVLTLLAAIVIPVGFLVNFAVQGYAVYHDLTDDAHGAVDNLQNVKTLFNGISAKNMSTYLTTSKLTQAKNDILASESDFNQLKNRIDHTALLGTITQYFPQYKPVLQAARQAAVVGDEVDQLGLIGVASITKLAPDLASSDGGSLLATSSKPLITPDMLSTITSTIDQMLPILNQIEVQGKQISWENLPINSKQINQVQSALTYLPTAITDMKTVENLIPALSWILGVDGQRTFLVQTLDTSELRASGGFTGQYANLTVNGGRVGELSLKDIGLLEDFSNSSVTVGNLAPSKWRAWWPFVNFGLRDSNNSADFPTTAKLAIDLYKWETGTSAQGVIQFTPTLIKNVLRATGPIQVPGYSKIITADNLENTLHYYQLSSQGIAEEMQVNHVTDSTTARKLYTEALSKVLLQKVRSSSSTELINIGKMALQSMQTRDLQVYFTNQTAEDMLVQYGYAGLLDRSTTHDGLYVVQENISASKASMYVQTNITDNVTLDSSGGATHNLKVNLVYNMAGSVYSVFTTYYDYVRIYAPANASYISGDGFSQYDTALCTYCSASSFPKHELVCPTGGYTGSYEPNWIQNGNDSYTLKPLYALGGPTNIASDEAGRSMYGGLVIIPKNCSLTLTLSYYVPSVAGHSYDLLVQRQTGTFPNLDVNITYTETVCGQKKTLTQTYKSQLSSDANITLPAAKCGGK